MKGAWMLCKMQERSWGEIGWVMLNKWRDTLTREKQWLMPSRLMADPGPRSLLVRNMNNNFISCREVWKLDRKGTHFKESKLVHKTGLQHRLVVSGDWQTEQSSAQDLWNYLLVWVKGIVWCSKGDGDCGELKDGIRLKSRVTRDAIVSQ